MLPLKILIISRTHRFLLIIELRVKPSLSAEPNKFNIETGFIWVA